MPGELLVADLDMPSSVYGVHGAAGLTRWRSLAGGKGLRGPYEAVEWACVPPGGLSGEHLHSRTEEVYVLLTGEGEAILNGSPQLVRAGELILTGLGATHGLRNVGNEPLSWLTLEVPAPRTVTLARPQRMETMSMQVPDGKAKVVDLGRELDVDPRPVLEGPLRRIRMLQVAPGMSLDLTGRDYEHTVFVLEGRGSAVAESVTVPVRQGTAVTTSGGEDLRLVADAEGLRVVCASFEISLPPLEGGGVR
ncbi:cupin domain-containing protein [Streptomyces violaceus]|uniref:cupin domain-containing protein n=1 Tax=Streptomyces violaceus TaxID=1936 RepID=UPI002E28D699|nr:cupin domain-containing protein [Streptomyces violaceus]